MCVPQYFWTTIFVIYVNDVIKQYKETDSIIVLYADDTVIYYAHKKYGLEKLQLWFNKKELIRDRGGGGGGEGYKMAKSWVQMSSIG